MTRRNDQVKRRESMWRGNNAILIRPPRLLMSYVCVWVCGFVSVNRSPLPPMSLDLSHYLSYDLKINLNWASWKVVKFFSLPPRRLWLAGLRKKIAPKYVFGFITHIRSHKLRGWTPLELWSHLSHMCVSVSVRVCLSWLAWGRNLKARELDARGEK